MTIEGITRSIARMIRWACWERNVLVLVAGSLDSSGNLRFNEKFQHLALQQLALHRRAEDSVNDELEARVAWLRKKWAHSLAPIRVRQRAARFKLVGVSV